MLPPLACCSSVRGMVAACSWRLHLHAAALQRCQGCPIESEWRRPLTALPSGVPGTARGSIAQSREDRASTLRSIRAAAATQDAAAPRRHCGSAACSSSQRPGAQVCCDERLASVARSAKWPRTNEVLPPADAAKDWMLVLGQTARRCAAGAAAHANARLSEAQRGAHASVRTSCCCESPTMQGAETSSFHGLTLDASPEPLRSWPHGSAEGPCSLQGRTARRRAQRAC